MAESMKGKYVPVFLEWLDVTQDLTAEEKGNLIDAVVSYASGIEYEHLLTGCTRIAFRFLKGQIDRNKAISEKRSKAGSNKPEQTGTNGNKPEQPSANAPKEKEKEKEKENNKDSSKPKRFTPPTLDEVKAYCAEIGFDLDAEYFLDYQDARNWVLSNGKKAQDWKAVLRTWKHNNFGKGKKVNAQQYQQRDYSGEQSDAMRRMLEGAV